MDAQAWNERYAAAGLVWGAEPNRFVAAELAPLRPGRALDLACGEGRNAIWLATRGWRVTAVDFSDVAIDKGRQAAEHARAAVDWVVADVLTYRPEPAAFDVVLVAYLHLPAAEGDRIWAVAAGGLAPGSTLLIVGHDRTNLTDGTGGPQDPAVLYDLDTIVAALEANGLAVERAERVRRPVPQSDGGSRDAIDTVVRARRAAPVPPEAIS